MAMEGNQSLAKIGVFLLLGLNVGAYYYFWPRNQDASKPTANAATPEKGATKLLPTGGVEEQEAPPTPFPLSIPGQPRIPAPPVVMQTEPLIPTAPAVAAQPVSLPRTVERRAAPDDEKAIRNLLKEIEDKAPKAPTESSQSTKQIKAWDYRDSVDTMVPPLKTGSVDPPDLKQFELPEPAKEVGSAPPKTDEKSPFQQHYGGPVGRDGSLGPLALPRQDVAIASPLIPKAPPARWVYTTDKVGERTQLTARLRDTASERFLVEFRIQCDRVEATPTGMKATGNISFVGAGWKGTCQSLTLTAQESRIVFENRVEILQDILGTFQESVVRGDRITWDLPAPAAAPTPTNTGITQPLVPILPGLDSPK
jgi:hypothetical protein